MAPRIAACLALLWLVAGCASSAQPFRIRVRALADAYDVTVLSSRHVLRIPRGGLLHEPNPRSFVFRDHARALIVSGWFESERRFRGTRAQWDEVIRDWRQQDFPAPQNVAFTRVNHWDAVFYDIPIPGGANAHVQAHWVEAGTWIDLHLSLASRRRSDDQRAILLGVLESFQVRERT